MSSDPVRRSDTLSPFEQLRLARQILEQEVVPMNGRKALRTELVAELDGVPKHFTVYVLKKDGCVYDFLHIADRSAPGRSRDSFERFVQGFATLSVS